MSDRIQRETCAKKSGTRLSRGIVPGSKQAENMARVTLGTRWRTALELSVLALATKAPVWAGDLDDAWKDYLAKPSQQGKHGVWVEYRQRNGELEYRATGTPEPLPSGAALIEAIERRLGSAIKHLASTCDGGTHPAGHTMAAIEAVPTIAAARAWLAERRAEDSGRHGDPDPAHGDAGDPARIPSTRSGGQARSRTTPEQASEETREVEGAIRKGANPLRKRAVELHAMDRAKRYYKAKGWSVTDVSKSEPFDLFCTRDGEELHVEVKGRSTDAATVILTRNEVTHAHAHPTALFVVSNISVSRDKGGTLVASGGDCLVFKDPWEPDDNDLTPLAHSYRLPDQA